MLDASDDLPGPQIPVYNLEVLTLHIFKDKFILEPDSTATHIFTNLVINRANADMTEREKGESFEEGGLKKVSYSVFLGILQVLKESFLVFVSKCEKACSIERQDIFEIKEVVFVKCSESEQIDPQIEGYLSYMRDYLLKEGFYFSYNYDLSLSRQAYAQGRYIRLKYFWNAHMGRQLLQCQHKEWFVGIIQGSIRHFSVYIQGEKLSYYLITRRSHERGGTRYNARGIDSGGYVANFCEAEQLVITGNNCSSHVQIRGSVPAFWKQSGIYAEVQFFGSHEGTLAAFEKHFNKIEKIYGSVMCINLLSKHKSGQSSVTQYYQQLVKELNLPKLKYEFYDFHFACKGQKFQRSDYLIEKLSIISKHFGFYFESKRYKKESEKDHDKVTLKQQTGVMRTNCLDCLDRTNLVQSKIAFDVLSSMLVKCGFDLKKLFGSETLLMATHRTENVHPIIHHLKHAWADNGDMISRHYTGTGSTHTNVTRTGRRDLKGIMDHGLKTLGRFYKQYMEDNYKQEVIDILLGKHTETINLAEFETRLKTMKQDESDLAGYIQL